MALLDALGYDGKTYSGQEFRLLVAAATGGRSGMSAPADMVATPQGSPNNTVSVAVGTAVIPATHAGDLGSYEQPNDAALTSPTFAATAANPRWDLLILEVIAGVPQLTVVAGTASGSPSYPSLAAHDNYVVICGVKMPANKSIIDNGSNGTIEDRRSLWPAYVVCTSTTRPPIPFAGQRIYETDTDRSYDYTGSAWRYLFGGLVYSARAYRNAALNIAGASAVTLIAMDTESWDYNNNFSTATGQYTVPVTGLYRVDGEICFNINNNPDEIEIGIHVNTVLRSAGGRPIVRGGTAGDDWAIVVSDIVAVTAGDTIDIRANHLQGGNVCALTLGSQHNYISIIKIG